MKKLLEFLIKAETGMTGPKAYEVIIGRNEAKLDKPLTSMTVAEVLGDQKTWMKRFNVTSGAAGAYQIINSTLRGLVAAEVVRPADKYNALTQDKLGAQLVLERGYDRYMKGLLSLDGFALNLAKEWASMPVLKETKRNSVVLKRGQSYYDGVAGNSARVKPEELEQVLKDLRSPVGMPATPIPTSSVGQSKETTVNTEVVEVKSAWFSKINWTQFIGLAAMVATLFGIPVTDELKVQIIALIGAVQSIATWYFKTFATKTITAASAKKF